MKTLRLAGFVAAAAAITGFLAPPGAAWTLLAAKAEYVDCNDTSTVKTGSKTATGTGATKEEACAAADMSLELRLKVGSGVVCDLCPGQQWLRCDYDIAYFDKVTETTKWVPGDPGHWECTRSYDGKYVVACLDC